MQTDGLLHRELTYRIIGILFKVHKKLGCGFPEKIYQRAIEIELEREGISYTRQKEFKVEYDARFAR
jgi:GxxExxY protein